MKKLPGIMLVLALAVFASGCGETTPPAKSTPPMKTMTPPGPAMPTPGATESTEEKPAEATESTEEKPAESTEEKPAEGEAK